MMCPLSIASGASVNKANFRSAFASSGTCAQCHQKEHKQWVGSHHDLAMQKASSKTVLGDFNHVTFDYHGDLTTFYKKNDRYYIRTRGPNGKKQNYVVKYTFGGYPLQQYLIQLSGGRLQAFTIAWNVQRKKWFHLHPHEKIMPSNPLHWAKKFYNWNSNCGECHSTNLQKKYDPETKTYHTTWSEINVGCQACHGPGKQHLEWAKNKSFTLKYKGLIKPYGQLISSEKIERCAGCHSRRHQVSNNDRPGEAFFDHFMPALLRNDLYHFDGQIKDEVFVYGSFLQSKMYRAGVVCTDCHNPHSLKLRRTGNDLCAQCHKRKNYNSPKHFHHKRGSAGAQCVNCHMPEKAYLQIDFRRDHSFRVPRPDLTEKIGTPNACGQCHTDKTATWASKAIRKWYGEKTHPLHYGEIFLKALKGEQNVGKQLISLSQDKQQANIVRATAIALLAQYQDPKSIKVRIDALANNNVLIREAALRSLAYLPVQERIKRLAPLLKDPVRAIRIEAASILVPIPESLIPPQYNQALKLAIDEYKSLQESNLDFSNGHFNLGNLYQKQNKYGKAIKAYELSIKLDKHFYLAPQNLSALLNKLGRNDEAKQVLSKAIQHNKGRGGLYYSLGLLLAEENEMDAAAVVLKKAVSLLPHSARVQYNYALVLQKQGDIKKAEVALMKAYKISPNDPDVLYALTIFYMRQKRWAQALRFSKALHLLFPESSKAKNLLDYIASSQSKK